MKTKKFIIEYKNKKVYTKSVKKSIMFYYK